MSARGRFLVVLALAFVVGILLGHLSTVAYGSPRSTWAPQRDLHGTTGVQVTVRRVTSGGQDYDCLVMRNAISHTVNGGPPGDETKEALAGNCFKVDPK